jgi:FAD/FMN-containing dehydrogenase
MKKGSILIRFDLMRRTRLPADPEEPWVEVEPGTLWLELDNDLRSRGRGLAVYPTSAPRATVGGWLAIDGLGVGSFEYGWLRENVLSASVVLPGGERREVRGEDLRSFVEPGGSAGIVVGAKLRTRRADTDVPFAATFTDAESLAGAVTGVTRAGVPLWHLAFLNPEMARVRGLGEDHLLFGAYPRERAEKVEENLRGTLESYRGRVLAAAEAYRVWTERFFPVAPSHPTPKVVRKFVSVAELPEALGDASDHPEHAAVQGTVARSEEVLLLTFDAREEGWRW